MHFLQCIVTENRYGANMTRFFEGDYVRLKTGKTKMIVVNTTRNGQYVIAHYVNCHPEYLYRRKFRLSKEFVMWSLEDENMEKNGKMDKLYRIKRSPHRIGRLLVVLANDQYVLEFDNGMYDIIFSGALEEVADYTVRLIRLGIGDLLQNYTCQKGVLNEKSLLYFNNDNSLWKVIALDTKAVKALPLPPCQVILMQDLPNIDNTKQR
jgi:hypothetical protein